ncbi:AFR378Wp [Eremothecium gossypii ATCC 10895]|uniref:AFR378Wp n=1 Tax=Eremothecium gossypii (strain ATCC 10895 / CBS 109.51 / FGSC 9923 / NRRL Y-1056) TaxID=284811 RepID=Q753D8_EREGS|nr:AFR378Wp [Eremothecium gossypii ATCC 10895]AAS53749.2 AFR378Wp [Eremothecium gossypii ATCC 10895]
MFNSGWKRALNDKTFSQLDLDLFTNYKCGTLLKYVFGLWGLTLLRTASMGSDLYTFVKMLAYKTRENEVVPLYVPFHITKWIFVGSVIASFLLAAVSFVNGIRIYRTNNISLTYVNHVARTLFSITQYRIFCVYNRVTPKGAFQKMAFFTFFELNDCMTLLLIDSPRQVLNGLTLWSVLLTVHQDNLIELEQLDGLVNRLRTLAEHNRQEALILSSMLVSFTIWVIFILKLLCALLLSPYIYYKIFSKSTSGLKQYVCITVSRRVDHLVKKYRAKLEKKRTEKELLKASSTDVELYQLDSATLVPSKSSIRLPQRDLESNPFHDPTSYSTPLDSQHGMAYKQNRVVSIEDIPSAPEAPAPVHMTSVIDNQGQMLQRRFYAHPSMSASDASLSSAHNRPNVQKHELSSAHQPLRPSLLQRETMDSLATQRTRPPIEHMTSLESMYMPRSGSSPFTGRNFSNSSRTLLVQPVSAPRFAYLGSYPSEQSVNTIPSYYVTGMDSKNASTGSLVENPAMAASQRDSGELAIPKRRKSRVMPYPHDDGEHVAGHAIGQPNSRDDQRGTGTRFQHITTPDEPYFQLQTDQPQFGYPPREDSIQNSQCSRTQDTLLQGTRDKTL